jgi:N-acetylmuramoyl-L-alanine amidase
MSTLNHWLRACVCVLSAGAMMSGTAQAKYFRTVVIDPGHGGHDKGGRNGLVYEKHLALDTAARLEAYLKAKGFRVEMTRRSDYFISLPQRVSIGGQYQKPIFVSVHYNYTWKRDVSGLETFYNSADSMPLATFIQQGMLRRVRSVNRGVKFARYYVIRHAKCPAVLVECGFVSHAGERERTKMAWYRQAIAEGIGDGIIKFRNSG